MDKSKLLENTRRFRRTKKGLLTNLYHKMKGRNQVSFSLDDFHSLFLNDKLFDRLFIEWEKSKYDTMKKPSIDRINHNKPYTKENIQLHTWAENRYKQTMERRSRKGAVLQYLNGELIARYKSQREAVMKTGISQGNMSECLNGKRKHCGGSIFEYEVIGNIHENADLLK